MNNLYSEKEATVADIQQQTIDGLLLVVDNLATRVIKLEAAEAERKQQDLCRQVFATRTDSSQDAKPGHSFIN